MKTIRLVLVCLTCAVLCFNASAQKKPLDEEAYNKWIYLENEAISDDGQWVTFRQRNKDSLRVLYLSGNQKMDTLKDCSGGNFSPDSRFYIYYREETEEGKKKKIQVLKNLATGETVEFPQASSMTFLTGKRNLLKVTVQNQLPDSLKKKSEKANFNLSLYDPLLKDSVCFRGLSMVRNSADDRWLFLCTDKWTLYDTEENSLQVLPLVPDAKISVVNFEKKGDRMACLYTIGKEKEQRILLYDVRKKIQIDTITSTTGVLPDGFVVTGGRLSFSADGKYLFFRIMKQLEKATDKKKNNAFEPQIWSWNQTYSYLPMAGSVKEQEAYFCSLSLGKKKKLTLLSSEEMPYLQFPDGESEHLTIGFSNKPYLKYEGIEAGPMFDIYLVNMETGKQQKILEREYYNPTISSDKKYIAWFEPDERSWYSMNTETLEKRNITGTIDDLFHNDELDRPMHDIHLGSVGWSEKGHDIFINSKYDFWKIDAAGKQPPVCLTKKMGKQQEIVFRPIKKSESQRYYSLDTLYFTAFQPATKKAGYYLLEKDEFVELAFTDHSYSGITFSENGKHCIWKRSSFTEYPEIYYSDSRFTQIKKVSVSDQIQKEYNWATAELVKWSTFHKDTLQGILCKPEDFDPAKKYPMIVYFYEKKSDELHRYKIPVPIGTVVNWSYCASNGYLVFVPDVTFRTGEPGQSAYDAIISGVKAMTAKYDFIDEERIALNGHSWGGYQTAYLVTRTNLFKAAIAGAPVANMTSAYGGIRWGSGKARMFQYESGQSRIGGTLWEKPLEYIKNSPLFFAPQIETPLLIMHNDGDGSVLWEQGIELFMALRRLDKPVWLFNYKGQDHKLLKWEYRLDYSRRVMEFYDYYLKDGKKPSWFGEEP